MTLFYQATDALHDVAAQVLPRGRSALIREAGLTVDQFAELLRS